MSRVITSLALLLCLMALPGCGGPDTHDAVMAEQVALLKQVNKTLADVKDEASAKKATATIKSMSSRAQALSKRAEALGDPDAATEKQLKEKYEKDMIAETMAYMGNMMKIQQYPELAKAMEELGEELE